MKKRPGFTLLEVLISLSLAAFIMGTITRALVNLVKTTTRARQILELDHKVTIFFNQLDRDFIAALVPNPLHYDSEKEALAKDQASKNKSDVEKTSTDKPATEKSGSGKKKKPPYFAALCDEEETLKIDGKPHRLFKVAHFINTGPLYVHEERKVRLARVGYTLKKLKKKKEGDIDVYELFRKETADLANHTFKEDQDVKPGSIGSKDKKSVPVSTILVLDNIKDFFIEYSAPKPPPEKDNPEQSSKPVKKEISKSLILLKCSHVLLLNSLLPYSLLLRDASTKANACVEKIGLKAGSLTCFWA